MTDKEMLEYAAKAAGMNVSWDHYEPDLAAIAEGMFLNGERSPDNSKYWNPLTDDGDALRLAVKLGMLVSIINHPDLMQVEVTAYPPDKRPYGRIVTESLGTEHYAATRRAITRAAAEMGKSV